MLISCITSKFEKYILQRVHGSCIRIGHGYVLNGERHYIGRSLGWGGCLDSMKHTEELWHKLSIEVSDERHVDVYLGKRFVASFSSHFTTKGRGGLMLLSGNHESTFRRFDSKGNGCTYSIFHTNGYIFMICYHIKIPEDSILYPISYRRKNTIIPQDSGGRYSQHRIGTRRRN